MLAAALEAEVAGYVERFAAERDVGSFAIQSWPLNIGNAIFTRL
jgi:hypothetical protein